MFNSISSEKITKEYLEGMAGGFKNFETAVNSEINKRNK